VLYTGRLYWQRGVHALSYEKYGISRSLVERIKAKMKNKHTKEKVSAALDGITKRDLQNPKKIRALMSKVERILGVQLTETERRAIVLFILDQKIDPKNTFHLIKLWGMFR